MLEYVVKRSDFVYTLDKNYLGGVVVVVAGSSSSSSSISSS